MRAHDFTRSGALGERLAALVPGGAHTYAKGVDQYPMRSPAVIARGSGCHVWDADGNEFIEYGMGLRAVGLGHAYPPVIEAVRRSLGDGTNFTRPSTLELECAERFCELLGTDMVKFTKDGSSATTAALKIARAATGRDRVAICADQPFLSYDDWFIATTTSDGGIRDADRGVAVPFVYGDLADLERVLDEHGDQLAAVMMEPVRVVWPQPGYLQGVRDLCSSRGVVLVFDETISGFRHHARGAQGRYGVRADLSVWGKALANGFALSALAGTRDLMLLGDRSRREHEVFLLSTTHGAESAALAAAVATMHVYATEPVVEHMERQGGRLAEGLDRLAATHGVVGLVAPVGLPSNLMFSTTDADGRPSQALRTLLLQELTARGVIGPSLVVSYSHADADVDATLEAFDGALSVYAQALADGVEHHLVGPPSRPVFDRRWS
jgi:glutamate-1-semialdehyde 2,1-aminomutase